MDSPGVEVRPIKNMGGSSHFAEVFFDNVRVPIKNRLGDEGKVGASPSPPSPTNAPASRDRRPRPRPRGDGRAGEEHAEERPPRLGANIRRRLARADTIIEGMRLNGQRFLTKQLKGEPLTSETSINKLHRAFLAIEMGDLSLDIKGSASQYGGAQPAAATSSSSERRARLAQRRHRRRHAQHQKNIIAERILGLPKD